MRLTLLAATILTLCVAPLTVSAQGPVALGPLDAPTALDSALRRAVVAKAGAYTFVGAKRFARDSVVLVFDDSTLTSAGVQANTWMFGPPVTAAEADSCPPEKVLGRKIARAFWKAWGRPSETQLVIVAVRGTRGKDRYTAQYMIYPRRQLTDAWMGDPIDRSEQPLSFTATVVRPPSTETAHQPH